MLSARAATHPQEGKPGRGWSLVCLTLWAVFSYSG